MDERFQAILDSLPPKLPRSRLEPYSELIRELRRRGRTYREIAQVLAEKCQVGVVPSTVHDFVRVRTQKGKAKQQPVTPLADTSPSPNGNPATSTTGAVKMPAQKADAEEVRRRIEELKQRPVSPRDKAKPVFEYNPEEPLRLRPNPSKPGNDA